MKNQFYKLVKQNVAGIPCSGYLDFSFNHFVVEENLMVDIISKYSLELVNFEQKSDFRCFPTTIREEQSISENTIYHFTINNQLYLEYETYTSNILKGDKSLIKSMLVYSSKTNQKELISFLEYISEYIKNNQ